MNMNTPALIPAPTATAKRELIGDSYHWVEPDGTVHGPCNVATPSPVTPDAGPGPFGCDPDAIDFHATARRISEFVNYFVTQEHADFEGELVALFSLIFKSGYSTGRADAEKASVSERRPAGLESLAALPVIEAQSRIALIDEEGQLCIQNDDLCPCLREGDYSAGETRGLIHWFSKGNGTPCDYPGHDVQTIIAALTQERDMGHIAITVTTAVLPNGDEVHF